MSDAEALEWLDRLLSAGDEERAASLESLAATNRALHARLQRMLLAALSPDVSRPLAPSFVDPLAPITTATRSLSCEDVLAGYRLQRELGRGGTSVVWLAERADGVVKRPVAIKMPMFVLQGPGVERFTRERDALAALSHPNVARLYDAGVLESGQPFIVLEYVDGEHLTRYCDERRLDVRARLRLFLHVLGAVEHAHRHLVVHRDLKPSNILVDREGHVRLLDFGIAKLLGDREGTEDLTQQAGNMLTPQYAAPEQISGGRIATVTDVYSLGVILNELLTGSLPYPSASTRPTLVEVLAAMGRGELGRTSQVALDAPAALARGHASTAKLRRELTRDLDTIVSKSLRLRPEDRYASAAHLADDLRRYLDGQPIAARRPNLGYILGLAFKRHRLAAAVAGIATLMVLGASVLAWQQFRESRAHAARAATVRNFMFDLVNDAEPSEGQKGEITGRQMLDGAVARARAEFSGQPQLRGELLSELGRMYLRLEATHSALPVLEEAVSTLQMAAPPDDPTLNKSRGFLAGALLRAGGDPARIDSLARKAYDDCREQIADCYKSRAYANNILSQLAARKGDTARALAETRSFVLNTERGFGAKDKEVAIAYMSLAITARNAGQLREAGAAMRRAADTAEGMRLRAVERAQLDRTMAVIDLDLGRFAQARDRLLALIDTTGSATERALQWRILANVYAEMGDGEATIRAAQSALALLRPESREPAALCRQALARGLALTGHASQAVDAMDEVIRALIAGGRKENSTEVLRASRYRAEFLMRAGRGPEALLALRELRRQHEATAASPVERGLVLDLLGEEEARAGDATAARQAHRAAHAALMEQLPDGHPYLARNESLRSAHQ